MRAFYGFVLPVVLAAGAWAQTASSADKDFVKDTAQDTNYEIKSSQLALQKSASADIKKYANMVIRDHTRLKTDIAAAQESAGGSDAKPTLDMSASDTASYAKLKVLSGDSFDQAYLKGLLNGNDEAVQKAKQEEQGSQVPSIKKLAERRAELDTKHAEQAKALAQTHHVDTGS